MFKCISKYRRYRFRTTLLKIAEAEVGNGEEGSNNMGPHIAKYAKTVGMTPPLSWCAVFVAWVYQSACKRTGREPLVRSRASAKKLLAAIVNAGGTVVWDHQNVRSGDIAVWHRTDNPYKGHIGIITKSTPEGFVSIEGNKGKFPSKVGFFHHRHSEQQLYRVVRLPELV